MSSLNIMKRIENVRGTSHICGDTSGGRRGVYGGGGDLTKPCGEAEPQSAPITFRPFFNGSFHPETCVHNILEKTKKFPVIPEK